MRIVTHLVGVCIAGSAGFVRRSVCYQGGSLWQWGCGTRERRKLRPFSPGTMSFAWRCWRMPTGLLGEDDKTRPACPDGWGCGLDGICRRHSGTFEHLSVVELNASSKLGSGDFDGDGRADIVVSSAADLKVLYIDQAGMVEDQAAFLPTIGPITVGDVTGDRLDDLGF